jgi:signal transduction histidine kinase
MVVVSIISGSLILIISLVEQTSAMERSIIQHHATLVCVASRSIESGYIVQRWPFKMLEEIGEFESVLFWWIVTPEGEILLADDTAMWQKRIDERHLGTHRLDGMVIKDSVFYKTGEGIKLIVNPLMIEEDEQWKFYMGVSLEPIVATRNGMILGGVGTLAAITAVAFLISAYLSRDVTRPIMKLTAGAKAISQGDLDYKIEVESEDEIGKLADVFNKMTVDLKKSRQALENYSKDLEKEVKKRTAELNDKVVKLRASEATTRRYMKSLQKAMEQLKESQRMIERKNVELRKLDRLKTSFINIISHELRTPLSVIKGYTQTIHNQTLGSITEEQEKALSVVLRNTDRLNNLIQDLLDTSQLQSGYMEFSPQRSDVKKLVDEAVETIRPSADLKDIKINLAVEEGLPELIIDGEQIKKVIMHLVNNSIKFSPDGSVINVRAKKQADGVLFEVQDFGRGIPKTEQKKVFETFYQVDSGMDRKFGGAGLGLAISRFLVNVHGGDIWVESDSGKGSTFRFTLPIKPVEDIRERYEKLDIFRKNLTGKRDVEDSEGF